MPLQPPSPEFLSGAPDPDPDATGNPVPARSGWRRPAELAGVAVVLLAVILGMTELIT